MSGQTVIDSLEFARASQELRGSIPVARLGRLEDCLSDTSGSIAYAVRGGRDEERRPILQLDITGELRLQCQRCLGPLEYPLQVSNTLLLVRPGEDLSAHAEDPEAPDCIEASPALDVAALVEDEILLSLPFAPRHGENTCRSVFGSEASGAQRPPAFARLAELKNRDKH
ncbi:MAG TPA: YceD family protein [Burkholderiales bacterium]|jgi:uncharacterized protein|nr:YceD family protein [Burkholderiales bacterium]